MLEINNIKQVAVITGGASGIGFSLAKTALKDNMIVFICDIENNALDAALSELGMLGEVYGYVVDVTKQEEVKRFAKNVFNKVSHIDYLFNNAGIAGALGFVWEAPTDILRHVFEVNVIGVIHCLQAFVPKMLEAQKQCHIVNMSSNAGVTSMPYFGQYQITKHGVVTLSESLHYELQLLTDKIKVSVVCPGFVDTNIGTSSRNYPASIRQALFAHNEDSKIKSWLGELIPKIEKGSNSLDIARYVFKKVKKNDFYIFPHKRLLRLIKIRFKHMNLLSCMPMPDLSDWAGSV